jgi:hypothetical protein
MGEVVNMLTELRRRRRERPLVRSMLVVTERGETRLKVTSASGAMIGDWPVTTKEQILAAAVMVGEMLLCHTGVAAANRSFGRILTQ